MEKVYRRCFPSLIIAINSGSDGRSSRGRGHGESEFQPRPRCHTHRFYSLLLSPSLFPSPSSRYRRRKKIHASSTTSVFRLIGNISSVPFDVANRGISSRGREICSYETRWGVSNVDETSNASNANSRVGDIFDGKIRRGHRCANIISHFHRSSDEIAARFHNVTASASIPSSRINVTPRVSPKARKDLPFAARFSPSIG